ncbi:MAG: glycosyltransferase family 4 protein [Pseudomonadota bacterium]
MSSTASDAKPSVCFVAPTAYSILSGNRDVKMVGGAELQQVVLARELVARGYRVSMVCIDHGQEDGVQFDGVSVYKCFNPSQGIPVVRAVYPRLYRIWQAMRRADADIYFQRAATRFTGIVALYAKRKGRKSIYSAANDPDFAPGLPKLKFGIDKRIFAYGVRNVDSVLVQNAVQQQILKQQFGRSSQILPNCLPSAAAANNRDRRTVLWAATFKPEKRPELFLELARRLPNREFVMVGGPHRGNESVFDAAKKEAETLQNVRFEGFVPYVDVGKHFSSAALLVNTSEYEGFPNTFLQAWSEAVPTLSFLDLSVEHDGDAISLKVGSMDELASATDSLLTRSEDRIRTGRSARRYFDATHNVDAVASRLEETLLNLMKDSA